METVFGSKFFFLCFKKHKEHKKHQIQITITVFKKHQIRITITVFRKHQNDVLCVFSRTVFKNLNQTCPNIPYVCMLVSSISNAQTKKLLTYTWNIAHRLIDDCQ